MIRSGRAATAVALLATLVFCGCSETWLERLRGGPTPTPEPTATPEPTPTPTPTPTPPVEVCNGLDDDGDGEVDEGFADLDADGHADCVDGECTLEMSPPEPVEGVECGVVDFGCHDAWDVQVEWQWNGPEPNYLTASDAVSVGLVADSDGDGLPSAGDLPAVVVAVGWEDPEGALGRGIVALDGATGAEAWWPPLQLDPQFITRHIAAVDLDGDGWSELLARRWQSGERRLTAEDRFGQELWSTSLPGQSWGLLEILANDAGSGLSVLVDGLVVDGASGEVLLDPTLLEQCPVCLIHNPTPVDLDGDGIAELAVGPYVLDISGQVLWEPERAASYSQWWVPIEFDGDVLPELALVGEGWLDIYDGDGSLLHQSTAGNPYPFPPCAADLDGDGEPELAWSAKPSIGSNASELGAWELDGTPMWSVPVVDGGWSGCSAFDFDFDGASELLYADEEDLYVFSGATGELLFVEPSHESQTILQYPVVADIDLDGAAEIVLVHSEGWESGPHWQGVTVLGHADSLWPGARSTWPLNNLRDYRFDAMGNFIGEPATLAGETNLLRSRASIPSDHPDLQVRVVGSCLSGCSEVSVLDVAVEVTNNGTAATGLEVSLELFVGDSPTPEQTATVPPLAGGSASEPMVFELPAKSVAAPLRFLVDGACGSGSVVECDESNNELVWMPPVLCP